MNLPLGQGKYVVYGMEPPARDDNRGLTADQQPLSRIVKKIETEIPIYLTDSEDEARKLVTEGGFSHGGRFLATTRYVNREEATRSTTIRKDM